ncbi:mediator complex subunit, partial [Haplosporangium sp. Z 11]
MEPNGTVKGASSPMPAHATVPAPVPLPAPTPVPASVPVLPDNMNAMVPLGAIIHRMANEAFADLSNLSEVLPSMNDTQRKLQILDYALSKREQFIKLLVLTKWAKNAKKFQQCQNIVGFLQNENQLFTRAIGGLFETYSMFGRARVRNFDIPTAIDVLTTGTYQRLPSRIKQAYIEEKKPTRTEIATTLEKLDDVIRMRLLCDELVPPPMKYTIGKGKAKFVVANEFEVTLTIAGPGSPKDIPWRIVSLKILVKPVGGSFQGLETSLNDVQMRAIVMYAQKELEAATVPVNAPAHAIAPVAEKPKAPANQALLRLYDYLHMLSLHLLIELVYIQAFHLLRSGWTDRLRVEVNQSRSVVRLVYWNNGFVPQPAQPPPSVPASKRRPSTSLTIPSMTQSKDANQIAQHEHYLEIRIEERAGPTPQISEDLAGALVDPKILGYPKAYIKVVWSQVVKDVVSEQDIGTILELDPSNLNIERLLLRAVNMHTGQVMQGFYDRLWSHIEDMKAHTDQMSCAHFSKEDVQLETIEVGDIAASAKGLSGPQALLVRLKGDRWIRIRIDVRTGRVVVCEVGKTGEGDDPIIATFQTRLNENAHNIVEALVSLRFSITIVELECAAILLGLQPYRRLALAKQDALQFGNNIQQILFLQYPQHPRHYLVIGVMNQTFYVWQIEVVPAEKEVAGNWLTLKSIVPVYWRGLKRHRMDVVDDDSSKLALKKRKSVQFDVADNDTSSGRLEGDEMTIDQDVLSKLEALCRVRICHIEAKEQLQQHGILFRHMSAVTRGEKSNAQGDSAAARAMSNMIPLLRLEPSTISAGTTNGMFEFVSAKLTGWWDNQRETCNFVVLAKFMPDIIPANIKDGALDACVHYYAKAGMLCFTYKTRGPFIQQFKDDWETIVRMLKITCQLHAPTLSNPRIQLRICHLHQVQLAYFGRYSVTIKWVPACTTEKRSVSGIVIPCAPRIRQGQYEITFAEVESGTGRNLNPHRRMKYFLQDMFNREADLHSLINTLVQTCAILEVLDILEDSVKEDSMGVKLLSVVPRSAHHIRVVYGSKYALDIRSYSRTHLSMFDASFPSESFSTNLPPPPAPFVAPGLLTPAGRNIPPTTKGHLHYGAIANLQGVIGAIDIDKEDEEFNELQSKIVGISTETSIRSAVNASNHHQQYLGKSADPADINNHDTINTTNTASTSNDRIEEEA